MGAAETARSLQQRAEDYKAADLPSHNLPKLAPQNEDRRREYHGRERRT